MFINIIIPAKIVAWMRNIVAVFVSLALILVCTPSNATSSAAFFLLIGMPLACFLIVMIATRIEILAGILFAIVYSSVDMLRMKLEHSYIAQDYGWLDFLGMCLCYGVLSLMGTTPVYLWRRWRRRQTR